MEHGVEHFDVAGVPDDIAGLRNRLDNLADGDYIMGVSVVNLGANFFQLFNVSGDISC